MKVSSVVYIYFILNWNEICAHDNVPEIKEYTEPQEHENGKKSIEEKEIFDDFSLNSTKDAQIRHTLTSFFPLSPSLGYYDMYSAVIGETLPKQDIIAFILSRQTRQVIEDPILLFDFVIFKHIRRILSVLQQENIIELNNSLDETVLAIFYEFVIDTEFYKVVTKQIDDDIGICSTFNTPKWWLIQISVPNSDNRIRIIDLLFDTSLRHYFRWLCVNQYIITEKSPIQLAAIGLNITRQENFYKTLTEGAEDKSVLKETLSKYNWWMQEGKMGEENGELIWTSLT